MQEKQQQTSPACCCYVILSWKKMCKFLFVYNFFIGTISMLKSVCVWYFIMLECRTQIVLKLTFLTALFYTYYICLYLYLYICLILEYIYATLPRTQRGQPIVLGGDPKGKNFLYTNGNSVIIRNIEVNCPLQCKF